MHTLPSLKRLLILAAILCASANVSLAQTSGTYICHARGIEGYETEHAEAGKYIGFDKTGDVNQIKVYVTVKGEHLYLDSNFLPAEHHYPTKIRTAEDISDVELLTRFLLDDNGNPGPEVNVTTAMRDNITFYINPKLLAHPKYGSLNFGQASRVFFIGPDGTPLPTKLLGEVGTINQRLVMVDKSLGVRLDVKGLNTLLRRLKSQPFDRANTRVLSLVTNTATNQKIRDLIPAQNQIEFPLSPSADLRKTLSANRGKSVFTLGHIEEESFVVRDASDSELLRIPVRQLEEMAGELDIDLFAIGCNSAACAKSGVLGEYNTVHAVESLSKAMSSAENKLSFMTQLSSPEFILVIDETVLRGGRTHVSGTVYKVTGATAFTIATAVVGKLLLSAALPSGEASESLVSAEEVKDSQAKTLVEGLARLVMELEEEERRAAEASRQRRPPPRRRRQPRNSRRRQP